MERGRKSADDRGRPPGTELCSLGTGMRTDEWWSNQKTKLSQFTISSPSFFVRATRGKKPCTTSVFSLPKRFSARGPPQCFSVFIWTTQGRVDGNGRWIAVKTRTERKRKFEFQSTKPRGLLNILVDVFPRVVYKVVGYQTKKKKTKI